MPIKLGHCGRGTGQLFSPMKPQKVCFTLQQIIHINRVAAAVLHTSPASMANTVTRTVLLLSALVLDPLLRTNSSSHLSLQPSVINKVWSLSTVSAIAGQLYAEHLKSTIIAPSKCNALFHMLMIAWAWTCARVTRRVRECTHTDTLPTFRNSLNKIGCRDPQHKVHAYAWLHRTTLQLLLYIVSEILPKCGKWRSPLSCALAACFKACI